MVWHRTGSVNCLSHHVVARLDLVEARAFCIAMGVGSAIFLKMHSA